MRKTVFAVLMLLSSVAAVGQGAYKGLTPGRSTKADVVQVLGMPVKSVSPTLIEYRFPEAGGKAYVQYRDGSDAAVVERIELTCEGPMWDGKCYQTMKDMEQEHAAGNVRTSLWPDAVVRASLSSKQVIYYGAPRFVVISSVMKESGLYDLRFAFYSRELFEGAKPKGGCTGSIFGEWETNRGRMVIERVGDLGFKGTYSNGNGTFTGKYDDNAPMRRHAGPGGRAMLGHFAGPSAAQNRTQGAFVGEWKDDTGAGTMTIPFEFQQTTFRGKWTRTTGSGPAEGTWEGKCVKVGETN